MADQQWTWVMPESSESKKSKMTRQDAHDRVSGNGIYTRDVCLPGMLYAKVFTSPYAAAKIVNIDTSRAKALAGVMDILTYQDKDIAGDSAPGSEISMGFDILTLPGTSDFYQHPMGVVVVADSEETCDRALKLIEIQWEELPFILDMDDAAKPDAQRIMPEVSRGNMGMGRGRGMGGFGGGYNSGPNIISSEDREFGSVEKGLAEADKVIEYTIKRGMNSVAGTEAMVCVAQWKNDAIDLYVHHQSNPQSSIGSGNTGGMGMPFGGPRGPGGFGSRGPGGFGGPGGPGEFTRPPSPGNPSSDRADFRSEPLTPKWRKINVTFPYQGSWFGGLAWLGYSTAFVRMAVVLAKRAGGRPVKLLYDESGFYCGGDEFGTYRCKVGAKKTAPSLRIIGTSRGNEIPASTKPLNAPKSPISADRRHGLSPIRALPNASGMGPHAASLTILCTIMSPLSSDSIRRLLP